MKLNLREDKKAKSKSFFFKGKNKVFDRKLFKFMINYFYRNKKDLRICMHDSPLSKFHNMIVLHQKKKFYKPHKHIKKSEIYTIIFGKLKVILFDDDGKKKFTILLKKNEIFHIPNNTFHTTIPVSNFVIFSESKLGPFLKKNDSIFPKWLKKYEVQYKKKNIY